MLGRYQTPVGSWSHRTTFFWATTGATIGLSDLWTFPHMAGQNGGGVFILFYLACLLILTLPLVLTEAVIGRGARHGVVIAIGSLARGAGAPPRWIWSGRLSVLAGFLVLTFYAVIGGICLAYVFYAAYGRLDDASPRQLAGILASLVQEPENARHFMGWHAGFLILVLVASMQGVTGGLERALRVVVPAFMLLLGGLLVFAIQHGNFPAAVDYLLVMRPEDVTFDSVRKALTHAFYTLSLGTGILIVFGAYSAPTTPLKRSVLAVALVDTLIAIVAGLVLYTLVFSHGTGGGEPLQGFRLVFIAIPESVGVMPGGQFVLTAFFAMIVLAAWSSSLALLEPAVSWLQERLAAPRRRCVLLVGAAAWLVGLLSLFSFNAWSDITLLGGTPYRWIEMVTSTLLIPVVSILLAFFVGWALPDDMVARLIGRTPVLLRTCWVWVLRLILPAIIVYVGIHYAMQSGASLCNGGGSPFWCSGDTPIEDPAGTPDATSPEAPPEGITPGDGSATEDEPVSDPQPEKSEAIVPPGSTPVQARPGPEPSTPASNNDMLYHSV
ncbi:sodium-dependent transporter [Marinobacter halodurans]|uniref:Sodium-dependent transporter n=1 Tax=Marinobacter halodurans TaxID=2528979 RepID=A0ABY1ZLD5_9GAMM|nr:sodium-dependent transporter [Marinobacter halodurans]TBW52520.1 sodium-dependent transporter [Marinobacter halodurans]